MKKIKQVFGDLYTGIKYIFLIFLVGLTVVTGGFIVIKLMALLLFWSWPIFAGIITGSFAWFLGRQIRRDDEKRKAWEQEWEEETEEIIEKSGVETQ